ncbi:MAG: zinc-binding dehydrogenase [Salinibacter sp.]
MTSSEGANDRMRAACLHGPGDVRVRKIPTPPLGDGQVRLRSRSVGICGSDLHHFREGSTGDEAHGRPFVLGHELAGEVTAASADRLGLAPGTVVAIDPAHPCGACEWCERGHHNLCPHVQFKGVAGHPGGLAEYIDVHPEQVVPVPDDMGPDAAALLEPLGVALHAVDLADVELMDTVAVLGAGPIGLLVAQVAPVAGAGRCAVVDPLAYRTEVAERVGADRTARRHDAIAGWTDGRGADVVIEATNAPEGVEHAVESVRIGGTVVLVGIPAGNAYELTASTARRKGLTVKFCRRMGEVYARAIQLVTEDRVALGPLVTHRFSLEETPEGLALQSRYDDGVIKAMVHPNGA